MTEQAVVLVPAPGRPGARAALLRGISLLALAAGGATLSQAARAQATAYQGPTADANWSDSTNWTGGVPTPGSATTVDNGNVVSTDGGNNTGTLAVGPIAGSGVTVAAGTTLNVYGNSISNAGQIGLNGALELHGDVTLSGGGTLTITGPINPGSTGQIGTDGGGRVLTNQSTIQGSGLIGSNAVTSQNLNLSNSGVINGNSTTNALEIAGTGGTTNTGTLEATAGGGLILATQNPINNGGGLISANGAGSTVTNSTSVQGGTLSTSNGGLMQTGAGGATLDAGTSAGAITLTSGSTYTSNAGTTLVRGTVNLGTMTGSTLVLGGALELFGDTTLSGPGVVTITGNGTNSTGGQIGTDGAGRLLTNNVTIQGSGTIGSNATTSQNLNLANNGTINANTNAQTLSIQGTGGSIVNANTFEATNGGILNLQTTTAINNQAGTIFSTGTGSTVNVTNTTIQGGTLTTSGGGVIQTAGTSGLDGSTLGAITLSNGSTYTANVGLTSLAGTLNLGTTAASTFALGGQLRLTGDTTLSGPGVVTITGNPSGPTGGQIGTDGAGRLLTNNVTIQGSGTIGSNAGSLTQNLNLANNGTINANTNAQTLSIQGTGGTTNTGTLEATAGGGLILATQNAINNGGGLISANGAGSTVTISTSVQGGTLSTSNGGLMQTGAGGATLDAGTSAGAITLTSGSTYTSNAGTTLVRGTVNLGTMTGSTLVLGGALELFGDTTLSGPGVVTITGNGTNSTGGQIGTDGAGRLLTNNVTIQGSGTIGSNNTTYQNLNLTNNGTIDANTNGQTLSVQGTGGTIVNASQFQATNGGILNLQTQSAINNQTGTISATGTGSTVNVTNTTIQGGTLTSSGGGVIQTVGTSRLDGASVGAVTIGNGSGYTAAAGTTTQTLGTLYLGTTTGATLTLGGALELVGDTTLSGPGVVNITGNGTNSTGGQIGTDGAGRLLTNNVTIQGSGTIGSNNTTYQNLNLTNNGTIDANINGQTLSVQGTGGAIVNASQFQATNGGILNLQTQAAINNQTGTISAAGTGSTVNVTNTTIQGGALTSSGGGVIQTVGTATLDGASHGTISLTDGSTYTANTGLTQTTGTLALGTTTGSTLALGGQLRLVGDTTLTGPGSVSLSGGGQIGTDGSGRVLTNQSTIQGNGLLGSNVGALYNNGFVNNQGLILATGGTLNVAETGGITNSGTLQAGPGSTLNVTAPLTNFSGSTLTGGTYHADAAGTVNLNTGGIATNAATIILNGAGSAVTTQAGAIETTLTSNASTGNLQVLGGRSYSTSNAFANGGTIQLGGGSFAPASLSNTYDGTTAGSGSITGFGSLAPTGGAPVTTNAGSQITASGGTLTLATGVSGAGTVTATGGSTISLAGAPASNTVGVLALNAGGTLATAGNSVTVSGDYNNANTGTGNAFNKNANVTGGGQVLAAAGTAMSVTGTNVVGGTTANPTLNLGSFHTTDAAHTSAGASTTFQVTNSGTAASIRGALQTTGITSASLSGTGVTAGNFGPIAAGASSTPYTVTVTPTSAGALVNQSIHLASNFANVAEQTVAITGTGYNYAQATINTAAPVNLGNVRVGSTATASLNIGNTAPSGAFTEKLDGMAGTTTTGAATAAGSFTGLAAGSTSNAVSVGINTATAGAKSGVATVSFMSDAAGVDSLGNSALASQAVAVQGNVFRLATGSAATPVTLGNVHVGASDSAALAVTNTAPNDGFSEKLNAAVGGTTGAVSGTSGSVNLLAAGSTSTAIAASLNTATAGAKSGTVLVNFASDGTGTTGQAATATSSGTVAVSGNVYNLASSNTLAPVNFGVLHVGTGTQTQTVSVTNTAAAGAFSEGLDSSFGAYTNTGTIGVTASGAVTNLAAGSTDNSSLKLGVSTATAGVVSGTIQVNQASNGTIDGLANTALASQNPAVSGTVLATVTNLAQAQINNAPVSFGNVRIGSAQSTALSITNTAPAGGFSESLVANTASGGAGASGGATLAGGFGNGSGTAVPSLAPQATDATHVTVGLNTAVAGAQNGTATIDFKSDGTAFAGGTVTDLGTTNVGVTGNVYRLANPTLNTPAVTLAARVGGTASGAVSLSNTSPDVYTEGLKASLGAAPSGFTSSGSIGNLAAGGTDAASLKVGLNTATSGTFTGTQAVALTSTGAGTTGAADLALAGTNVALTGKVYQTAAASVTPSVSFGTVHVGDTVAARAVTVGNTASGALVDSLTGGFGTVSGPFSGSGTLAGVAAGGTSTALSVTLGTATAGIYSGSANLALSSHDADLADVAVAAGPVGLSGTVDNYAVSGLGQTGGSGAFSGGANAYVLNFGTVAMGMSLMDTLFANNAAFGVADLLAGNYTVASGSGFTLSGFNGFSGLAAGMEETGLVVGFNTASSGMFSEVIDLHGVGSNASGYSGAVADTFLTIEGTVSPSTGSGGGGGTPVPEPGTLALLASGLAAVFGLRRRGRRVA